MRLIAVIAAVIGIGAGLASAGPLILNPSKDAGIGVYEDANPPDDEGHTNYGASTTFSGLTRWYIGIYDFDVHQQVSGPLHGWMVANLPTYAATGAGAKQAIADGKLQVRFGVAQVGTSWNGDSAPVCTITVPSGTWSEGNAGGTSIGNDGNWPSGTAATDYNPNDTLGTFQGPGWGTAGDQILYNISEGVVNNSTQMTGWGATADAYGFATLDGNLVQALLDDPQTVGLRLQGNNGQNNSLRGYFEGSANPPELIFTATAVPEPATMLLLLAGGLPLLARRRGKR